MTSKQPAFNELREIIFWQQLNKQIIRLRDEGAGIAELHQKAFQQFCLGNRLFKNISGDPFFTETPLVLMTNFCDNHMLTLKNERWEAWLMDLFNDFFILDVELALAGTFDASDEYAKKYMPIKPSLQGDDAEDDDELYDVIDRYNALLEKQKRSLPEILNDLYEVKALAMTGLNDVLDVKRNLIQDGSLYLIDFRDSHDKDLLVARYRDEFCAKTVPIVGHLTSATVAFKDMELEDFFNDVESRPALKHSVSDFIEHEREIQLRQSRLFQSFNQSVIEWQSARDLYEVKVCESSPIAFLKQPFPPV